jgi:DnaA N-terminal domain
VVAVDLGTVRERLRAAEEEDLAAWEQVRALLPEAVGESTFEIWLAPLALIAVDLEGTLIVSVPAETIGWVARRFGRILDGAARRAGRGLHIADEIERKAAESLASIAAPATGTAPVGVSEDTRFRGHVGSEFYAADRSSATSVGSLPDGRRALREGQSTGMPTYTAAYPSSYTEVYTQTREVS